jgi:hypothetical protein
MEPNIYFLVLACLVIIWLAFFIFSEKDMPKIGLLLLGLSPPILIYGLNPDFRIYSFHGFMHSGIVYQLLNGTIPPSNPAFSGPVLHYPWGWHCVAALITKLFNVTPFYSFAISNIVSLCLSMVLVYHISRLVIKNEKANIFSVLIALFAITMYTHIASETRGVPIADKFTNSNGIPLGLVFFLLAVFSLIKLFQNTNRWRALVLFLLSLICGGFFYPAFFPGILASTGLLCLVTLFVPRLGNFTPDLRKCMLLVGVLVLGTALLMPYMFSITSGIKTQTQLFNLGWLCIKLVRYIVVTLPLLVIIFFNRHFLQENTDRPALTVLLVIVIATLCCNILVTMPLETEVKYFMLSTVTLGIVGGIAFYAMSRRFYKLMVFFLVIMFLLPLAIRVQAKLRFHKDVPPVFDLYGERGRYLYSIRTEENELYEWIRNKTNKDSVFIDLKLTIPVLAQRRLFVGVDRAGPMSSVPIGMKGIYGGEPGYSWKIDTFLRHMNCYDPDLIDRRQALVKRIYNPKGLITDREIEELQNTFINVYVIDRTQALPSDLNREKFNQVFRSSQGQFLVHQLHFTRASEALPQRSNNEVKPDDEGMRAVPVPPQYEHRLLEAEYADAMAKPLEIAYDKDASQGMYVYAPNSTGNYYQPDRIMALYSVYIIKPGVYVLWGRTKAQNRQDDSFFIQVDNGANNMWKIESGNKWHWDQVRHQKGKEPAKFFLEEGLHTIKVKVREDGAKLDKLLLTNNVNFVFGGSKKQKEK